MCFSASASFISATCIAGLGIVTHKRVRQPHERPLAWIPILFAVQQFVEGFIWLSITHQSSVISRPWLSGIFLFFAWVVWPLWVPWASLKVEPNVKKRGLFKGLFLLGVLLAVVSLIQLFFAHPEVIDAQNHLVYRLTTMPNWPMFKITLQGIYVLVTLLPLLLSSLRGLVGLGITNFFALLISFLIFKNALPSVWCFFAALLSLQILFIIPVREQQKPH
jgi:hypothetical protein